MRVCYVCKCDMCLRDVTCVFVCMRCMYVRVYDMICYSMCARCIVTVRYVRMSVCMVSLRVR